ncbi:MAG: peptidyl-prolyl cis-trans isomerase [Myxococcales bacterium]|nr:peptidyl-prolyl cis-trans isomerase [Myxococcales bacterium]
MRAGLVTLALVVAAGCSRGASNGAAAVPLVAQSTDVVVATVDGRPIYAGAVADEARARGVDRKSALADLVDAELLAGEAARRGLDQDLHVRDETKGALVRRYLKLGFEQQVTAADVPDPLVHREYQRRLAYLNHDVYADVWHILVRVPKGASAEDKAKARARAHELAARARGMSLAAFQKLGRDEGLTTEEVVTARDGWVERPFSEAAFAQLKNPGDTSTSDVETSYGYHVLYLVKWIPAAHTSLAEAAPKIREGVFPEFQKHAFDKLVDDAMARYHVELHPEHLPQ